MNHQDSCFKFSLFLFLDIYIHKMAVTGRLADIAQKSAVLFLAGTTGKMLTSTHMDTLFNTEPSLLHGQCGYAREPSNGIKEARQAS